jgi:hypothetical protein
MPIEVEEPDRVRACRGVMAAERGLQCRAPPVGGQFGPFAAQGLDLGGLVNLSV